MKSYVEKIYSWNPTLFRDRFIPQDNQIIEIEKQIIGSIEVAVSLT